MIHNTYGSLTVIGFDHSAQIATVRCVCGEVEAYKTSNLVSGRVQDCKQCRSRKKYLESLKIDMTLLKDLSIAESAYLLGAFAAHLEISHRNGLRATSFAKFIKESLADPDFRKIQEVDNSWEAKLIRSNPQSYQQYQGPSRVTIK